LFFWHDCNFVNICIEEDLTSGAFWFYINTTFFPDDMQFKMQEQQFEDWSAPILANLNSFSFWEI